MMRFLRDDACFCRRSRIFTHRHAEYGQFLRDDPKIPIMCYLRKNIFNPSSVAAFLFLVCGVVSSNGVFKGTHEAFYE